jgi:hypothetical protein
MKGTYERIAETLLKGQPRAKPFCKLAGTKVWTGTRSLHWTPQSRRWQLFWRMKIRHEN